MNYVMNDNLTNRSYPTRIALVLFAALLLVFSVTQAFGDIGYTFYEDWSNSPVGPLGSWVCFDGLSCEWLAVNEDSGSQCSVLSNNRVRVHSVGLGPGNEGISCALIGAYACPRLIPARGMPLVPITENTMISFEVDADTLSDGTVFIEFDIGRCNYQTYISYVLSGYGVWAGLRIGPGEHTRNLYQDCVNIWSSWFKDDFESWVNRFCNGQAYVLKIKIGACAKGAGDALGELATISITTEAPPIALFKYFPEKPMVGGNIIFDANDSFGEIVKYQWNWGDGKSETISVANTSHVFESPGIYTVTLTVTDNDGITNSTSKDLDLTLKNGDLLLCRSYRSLIPNVDFWTHIGIYVEQSNQIVEALPGGVVATPLAAWSWVGNNGQNKTCVRALRVKTNDQSIRDRAVEFALDKVGQSFDLSSILRNKKQEGGECWLCKKWYCSELVWAAYLDASGGLINLDQDELGLVSPDDIDSDSDVYMIGEHKERIPQRVYWFIFWGEAYSPVDLEIIDPDGLVLNKEGSEIPDAIYEEIDVDEDGETEDLFAIPNPKIGDYEIHVIPEPNALPTDTYSLDAVISDQTTVLAEDVQIEDIPTQPYVFEVDLSIPTSVYRFWSPINERHFYTISESETDKLINNYSHVWTYEGIAYCAFATEGEPNTLPVYRFWSDELIAHFYTISEAERDKLINLYSHVWTYEGIAFYAYPEGQQPEDTLPVYRFWSPVLETHFYTMDETERNEIIDNYPHVWTYEGIAWYAYE